LQNNNNRNNDTNNNWVLEEADRVIVQGQICLYVFDLTLSLSDFWLPVSRN